MASRKLIDADAELLIKPYEAVIFRSNAMGLMVSVSVYLLVAVVAVLKWF